MVYIRAVTRVYLVVQLGFSLPHPADRGQSQGGAEPIPAPRRLAYSAAAFHE